MLPHVNSRRLSGSIGRVSRYEEYAVIVMGAE